jgi:hypothetical protein
MSLLLNTATGSHTWPRRLMLRDLAQTVCKGASRRSSPRAAGFVDLLHPWPPLAPIPILPCLTIVAPLHSVHGMRVGPGAAVQVALEAACEEARLPARPRCQGAWASGLQTGASWEHLRRSVRGMDGLVGGAGPALDQALWSRPHSHRSLKTTSWESKCGGIMAIPPPEADTGALYLIFEPTELSAAERDTTSLPFPSAVGHA